MLKTLVWFALIVLNIYVVDLCLSGLSYPSDFTVIAGLLGFILLLFVDVKIIKKLTKKKENAQ